MTDAPLACCGLFPAPNDLICGEACRRSAGLSRLVDRELRSFWPAWCWPADDIEWQRRTTALRIALLLAGQYGRGLMDRAEAEAVFDRVFHMRVPARTDLPPGPHRMTMETYGCARDAMLDQGLQLVGTRSRTASVMRKAIAPLVIQRAPAAEIFAAAHAENAAARHPFAAGEVIDIVEREMAWALRSSARGKRANSRRA